jgi:putative endonuclease
VGPGQRRDPGASVAHLRANELDTPRDAGGAHAHAGGMTRPLSQRNGQCAEDLAALYLAARGLELLARNVRCKAGEIDLVCREGTTLVVVEVRQRVRCDFGGALASVGHLKRRKLIRAARFLLHTCPVWRRCIVRFDVVAVQGDPRGPHEIAWVKDAFRAT